MTDLVILQGKTFTRVLRLASLPYIYKAITAITQAAPPVVTATGHGLLDGQRAVIVSSQGMLDINAANNPPRASEYHKATYIDANRISFNDINASGFNPYTGGGYLQYLTPTDLAGCTARMSIKDAIGGTELLRLDTTNSRIVVNNTTKTITLTVDATTTAAITWTTGVYDLELVNGTAVSLLLSGGITVEPEVTTL